MKKAIKTKTENNSYAVLETGGKQYIVSEGQIIKIAKSDNELKVGDKVKFDKVILLDDSKDLKVGSPYIKGHVVEGEVKDIAKDKKITVIKYKAKSNYFVKRGQRQDFVKVKIIKI